MREAWLLAAITDVNLGARHLPGSRMGIADTLSCGSHKADAAEGMRAFRQAAAEVEVIMGAELLGPDPHLNLLLVLQCIFITVYSF